MKFKSEKHPGQGKVLQSLIYKISVVHNQIKKQEAKKSLLCAIFDGVNTSASTYALRV